MEQQLKSIQEKAQLLLKKQTAIQKEIVKLRAENLELKQKLEDKHTLTENLQLKIAALSLGSSDLGEQEKKELERRLNHYMKEIDKCINLLAE
jgi:hypothetical protein